MYIWVYIYRELILSLNGIIKYKINEVIRKSY